MRVTRLQNGTGTINAELVATQCMVKLPRQLRVTDTPGAKTANGSGVRDQLRSRFGVEAAIAQFPKAGGAWIRLSYAVYNTQDDIDRLLHGVLQILAEQQGAAVVV